MDAGKGDTELKEQEPQRSRVHTGVRAGDQPTRSPLTLQLNRRAAAKGRQGKTDEGILYL